MSSNFIIASGFTASYARMGMLSQETIERYADAHGLKARIFYQGAYKSGRPAAWEKLLFICELLGEGYEYVCWIDADAGFVRFDEDIRREVSPDKDISLVMGDGSERRNDGSRVYFVQPCTGFVVVRNTPWSLEFLGDVWRRAEFTNHCWWELAAFIQLCGFHHAYDNQMRDQGKRELLRMVDHSRGSRSDVEIAEHIARLDPKWNFTDQAAEGNPMVRHYTGSNGPWAHRLALMERDLGVRSA